MFESVSGAILSRDKKCKVLVFGLWKNKNTWPLNYLQTVKEVKIFGIFVMNSYRGLLKRNWDYRFKKFEDAILSWSLRSLESLFQRVEVVKTFALSRVIYVASVLPLSKTMARKFEKVIGKFLWNFSGKVLRVPMNELKLSRLKGGLGLTCICSAAKSLKVSQILKLLQSGDLKSIKHIDFWIGEVLQDLDQDLGLMGNTLQVPSFFEELALLITDAKISNTIDAHNWRSLSNRSIYLSYMSELPPPRVEIESGFSLVDIWKRINLPCLDYQEREVMYLLAHNKIPVPERLFRIHLANDPYCMTCLDYEGANICDLEHFFCSCRRISESWSLIASIVLKFLPNVSSSSNLNFDLISLRFDRNLYENEIVWLISSYVSEIWRIFNRRNEQNVQKEKLFGFLKYKYRKNQMGARLKLQEIQDLI